MPIYGNDIRLNEAYFGKSKDLLAIEKQLHIVRQKWMAPTSSPFTTSYIGNFNEDKDTIKLNRLFEKAFNIDCFSILFIPSSTINAMTVPICYKGDTGSRFDVNKVKKLTMVDKNGFKFIKGNGLCIICMIYTGVAFNPKFTDGEILAIILHELGHNFADAIDPRIAWNSMIFSHIRTLFSLIVLIMGSFNDKMYIISQLPLTSNKLGKEIIKIRRKIYSTDNPYLPVFNFADGVIGFYNDIILSSEYIKNMVNIFTGNLDIIKRIASKAVGILFRPTAYRNEKIADRFATMYGYGPELTSGLSKMANTESGILIKEAIISLPIVGGIFSLTTSMINIILNAFDEHPIWPERLEDQLRALEHELDSNKIDPKMKKEIQNQINDIRSTKDQIINDAKTKNPIVDNSWFKKFWFSLFANGDIRHNLLGDFNNDIDKNIDKLRIKEGYDILGIGQRKFFS